MSNPFLNSNNRFKILDDDDDNTNTSFKYKGQKKYKPAPYEPAKNTFTTSKPFINNYQYNRPFRPRFTNQSEVKEPIIKKTFDISKMEFPDIQGNIVVNTEKKINSLEPTNPKFKDAIMTVRPLENENIVKKNPIKPGWVEISRVNRKTIFEEGPPSDYSIKLEELQILENDPHYIMNKAVNLMMICWNRHIHEYNNIHGEGEYEAKYILPPVYGQEYDSEEENEFSEEE